MKRFSSISIILTLAFFFCLSLAYGQEISRPAGRISSLNNQWKPGGIFYGKAPQQEILEGRTAYTKKFDRGNGLVDIYFGGPYHYKDESGAWQDIDLNIKPITGAVYSYSNAQNQFVSLFSKSPESGVLMRYKNASFAFGINTNIYANNWSPALSATTSKTNGAKISYSEIYEHIDLGYEVTTSNIQHSISFRNQNIFSGLGSQNDYVTVEETIKLPAGASMMDESGMLNASRPVKGNIFIVVNSDSLFYIQPSCIWDAVFTGNPEEQVESLETLLNFKRLESSVVFLSAGEYKLLTFIPVSWLKDPARVYPVTFDPTVGVGNQTSFNSSYRYPFNTCRQQRVSQLLFRKSDINAGGVNTTGTITSIDFFQNAANPIANNNVQIKMQEVFWNEMTTPTLTSAGFTPVYGPATQNFTSGSNTWQSISLSTPFAFTNTMNLLIDVRFANTTATSGCTCANTGPGGYWGWYNSPYAGHRWAYSNSAATPPSGADCEYNNSPERNPAYGYFIPATRITINTTGGCVPVTFNTQPQAQTVSAPAQAQFSVSVAGTAPVYQWEMSTNGGSTWANVPAAAPYSGTTTNQLTINPTSNTLNQNRYRCKVSNSCTSPTVTSNSGVLTINQPGCNTVLTPSASSNIPASGGTGSFAINVNPNSCFWSASENQSWLNITSALNGTGGATLNYSITANTGGPRSGVITVNGQTYTVNQLGAATPTTYTISGRVIENGSIGLQGVTISTTPNQGTAITDAQGYYTINVPLSYTGVVKASLAPYVFQPASQPVSSLNRTNKDFDADPVTFQISSSIIPPWQREGDDYDGSVTVNIANTTTRSWHLEADVYDANNLHIGNVQFPSLTTNTYSFNTAFVALLANAQLKNLSLNGRTVKYAAVFDANTVIKDDPGVMTRIIEKKWNKKNVVYWRNPSSPDIIKIPIRWSASILNQGSFVRIKRYNETSWILPFSKIQGDNYSSSFYENYSTGVRVGKYPITIKNNSGVNEFNVNLSTGYCEIKGANSNIYSNQLLPGDFKFEICNSQGSILEQGYFDLTKIGHIKGPVNSKKILIIVGGILNEAENSADSLQIYNATSNNTKYSYSVIEYVRNALANYSTWYIAQGNSNAVERNGYDIGIALEAIRRINNISQSDPNAEIDIFCHSKGGLDIRALLSTKNNSIYYNKSFSGTPFVFKDSVITSIVKKIVFLGTPHLGAPIENLLSALNLSLANSPGALDLRVNSSIVNTLLPNNVSLPSSIKYCNVTGFSSYPLFGFGDIVVPELSSLAVITPPGTKMQLRQISLPPLTHFSIHQSNILDYHAAGQAADFMCFSGVSNLEKIKDFIQYGGISQSCITPVNITIRNGLLFYKSKVSNAKVYLKKTTETFYVGNTDSDGNLFFESYLPYSPTDSLIIICAGVDSLKVPNLGISTGNTYIARAATFASTFESNKILYPVFDIVNEMPICQNSVVQAFIGGKNISKALINIQNSDTLFSQLAVTSGLISIPLDTGYNKLLIKLIGIDTVVLKREIYFLPNLYMSLFARDLFVTSQNQYLGAKVYVNSKYYTTIKNSNTVIKIFKDNEDIRFVKMGYIDTIYQVDTSMNINLSMLMRNYSSFTDSNTFNFQNRPNPQYWKTITLKDLSPIKHQQISAMQYDDSFTGMALKPQTRKFVFRNLAASGTAAAMKTAIALDQINTPDKDSVYLLSIKEGRYFKYKANQAGITEYDPDVQKVQFDQLAIGSGQKQEIVLMQKQAPVMNALDSIWHSGQTISFPINIFVTDPDSIKNDIIVSSADLKVTVSGNRVNVTAPVGFVGTTSFSVTAEHDFIQRSRTYLMKVIPPEVYIPSAFTPNADGLNDIIRPAFLGKVVSCRLLIYNRNGQKVFDTEDCLSGWDGKIRGQVQDPGAYVYYLRYQFAGEEEKETKGSFVLLK